MMIAAGAMVLGLSGLFWWVGDWASIPFVWRLPLTLGLIAGAGGVYLALAYVLGAIDMRNLGSLRRAN